VTVDIDPAAVDTSRASLVLALARELTTNAAKHADANRIAVSLQREGASVILEVSDDGKGIDAAARAGAVRAGHIGLATATHRAAQAGGRLTLDSASGRGTRVRVDLPTDYAGGR
jgi:signal transduction histidine kinase